MVNEQRVVELFSELVQISSPSKQERNIADVLKLKLAQLGLTVEEDRAGDTLGSDTGNLIARLPGNGSTVMFCAHMDTVEPGVGIVPVLQDGVFTSAAETVLGGDDKAGICAILEAVQVIKENSLPHPNLVVVFTIAEEGGLRGAKALDISQIGADMGFCLDAGGPVGTIINRGPAQIQLKAEIVGRAAHAGICPENGVSAIQVAAEGIVSMKLGRIDQHTTANIGIISGGVATNIIPEVVVLEGEARSLDPVKLEQQTEHMVKTLETVCLARNAKVKIEITPAYPAISLEQDCEVVELAIAAVRLVGLEPNVTETGGGSDANIFNGKGLPTANLGIGMEKVHTTDEFIRVQDILDVTKLLLGIIKLARA